MSRTNRNATGRLRGHVVHAACQPLERRVLLSLAPAGPEFRVNSHTIGDQGNARSAMDADGDFVVAWNGEGPGDTTGIFAQRYSANGASQGAQFRVNSSTTGTQAAAAIAADADGDFVIVWSVQFDVSNTDIHAQRYNAAGIPQGGEMQVNTYQTGVQRVPSVAMDAAGNFVVVWDSAGQDGSGTGVYAQCYDSSGVAQGSEFRVNITTANDQSLPKVAMDLAGNFAVTWSDSALDGSGLGTYTRRFNAAGVPQGGEFRVNTFTTGNQHDPAIGMDANGDFIIAWRSVGQDGVSDVGGIYAQRYDAAGVAQGGEFRVHTYTTGNQIRAQVAMDVDGDFVVGWNSLLQDGDSYGLYAQAFDAAGAPQGGEFRVNTYTTGSQRDTAVSRDHAGNTVIAWRSPQDGSFNGIYAQRYQESSDTAGPVVAGVFVGGSRAQPYTVYEAPLARVVVSFSEQLSDAGGPTGANSVTNPANWRVVHHDGATASDVAIATIDYGLNAASNRLEVTLNFAAALGAGGLQITATDSIHDNAGNALDGDLDGTPGGSAAFTFNLGLSSLRSPEFDVPSPPFGRQFHPALAADAAGNFVVAWESGGQDGSDFGVYARRFNASGVPLGAEFRVNTFTINSQINPAVAVDTDGDFVVVWESYLQDGSGSAVYAQRYNSAGVPQGAEFRVNTYTTGHQQSPAVAMDPDGAFIIAWGSAGQDGSDSGVYAKRYNAAGVLQGTEFRVNTYTTGWQRSPSVGADASGAFVVTWGGIGADGLNGVQGQRYDATGSPQGSEFNVVSDVQARPPRVAVDAQGGFAVAWSQLSQQLQERYALARRYDSTGAALGPAVTVAEPIHHGSEPAVATDRDGDFIVTWSHFMFSSDDGIWGRRFTAAGAPFGAAFRVSFFQDHRPAITMDPDGDFTVAWEDDFNDKVQAIRSSKGTPPIAAALTAQPDPVTGGSPVTLTASGVSDDGSVASVWFYRESNGMAGLQFGAGGDTLVGTDTDGADGWSVQASTAGQAPGVYTYHAQAVDNENLLSAPAATMNTVIPGAPAVTASSFNFATLPQRLSFTFDQNVGPSLGLDDIVVQQLPNGPTIAPSGLSYDAGTNTATFSFDTAIPDGRYRATLIASGISGPGGQLPADHLFEFTFLRGDANGDGRVNLNDFNILAANFGQAPRDFTQGDFDYSGNVNLNDFNLLASRFGTVVAPAAGAAPRAPAGDEEPGGDLDELLG